MEMKAEYIDDLDSFEEANDNDTDSPKVVDTKESVRRRIEDLQAERELNRAIRDIYDWPDDD